MAGKPWTTLDEERVRDMKRKGRPTREIAAALGRSASSVSHKIGELGVARRYATRGLVRAALERDPNARPRHVAAAVGCHRDRVGQVRRSLQRDARTT